MLSLGRLATTITLTGIFVRLRRGHWQNVVFLWLLRSQPALKLLGKVLSLQKNQPQVKRFWEPVACTDNYRRRGICRLPWAFIIIEQQHLRAQQLQILFDSTIFMSGALQYRWDVGTRKTQLLTTRNQGTKTGMGLLGPNPACHQLLLIKLYWHIVTFIRFCVICGCFHNSTAE